MENIKLKVLFSVTELLILAGLMSAVPFIVMIDITVIGEGPKEISLTEFTQEALILSSALLFFVGARRRPKYSGFLVLVGGFFGCMCIRECSDLFYSISRNFWVFPAILLAAIALLYAIRFRGTILSTMVVFFRERFFVYILIGLLVVLVFSRTFGSGDIWKELMGDNYDWMYKATVQEGLELLGYMLIAYGSVLFHFQKDVAHSSTIPTKSERSKV